MKKTRNCVFETNSSSSHSISISESKNLLDTIIPNEDGNVVLSGKNNQGQFGWGSERFNDAYTKALYCLVDNVGNSEKLDMLKKVIKEQTCCNNVIFDIESNYETGNDVYIDHESVGTSSACFLTEDTLKKFIFDKHSWLFITNDNTEPPAWFYDTENKLVKRKFIIESLDKKSKVEFDLYGEVTDRNIAKTIDNLYAYIVYDGDTEKFSTYDNYYDLRFKTDDNLFVFGSNFYLSKDGIPLHQLPQNTINVKKNTIMFVRQNQDERAVESIKKSVSFDEIKTMKETKRYQTAVNFEKDRLNRLPENRRIFTFKTEELDEKK